LVTIYICVPSDGINVARELYMIKYVNVDAYLKIIYAKEYLKLKSKFKVLVYINLGLG